MTLAAPTAPDGLFVGGRWRPATGGATFVVEDPATGAALAHVADAAAQDAVAALDAACDAQPGWAATAPRERAELLRRAFDAVHAAGEQLAALISLEMGKPLAESRAEVEYAAEFLRWFSEEAVRPGGDLRRAPYGAARILVTRAPVGACLLVTPWNFPLAMITRKVAPALAAGCSCVVKPAAQTPLVALALARLLQEAGLPDGVVNVVTTSNAAAVCEPLMRDGRLRKLSFTGSTSVGRRLAAIAGGALLRVSMELGGNAPFLVFADADPELAVEAAIVAKLRNGGQACTAANRIYVEDTVAAGFTERLVSRMAALTCGHGLDPATDIGPLIDERAVDRVEALVGDALSRGATLLCGGRRGDGGGHFFSPTVIGDVPAEAGLLHEEIFGPVAPVVRFSDEAEAVALANATPYGLAAYVCTRDLDRALRVCDALRTGMVAVNRGLVSDAAAPFGGVGHSGFGREGGRQGMDEYLDVKYLSVAV